jgi:small conductance mechanosensitive channel
MFKQLNILQTKIEALSNPKVMEALLLNLAAALLVILFTYILIKFTNKLLDKVLKNKDETDENQLISNNVLQAMRVLLKSLIFYGGILIATVIILEIFNVRIITPEDLKGLGFIVLKIIGIIIGAKLIVNLGQVIIEQVFNNKEIRHGFFENRRAKTLKVLLKSILTYFIFFMAGIMILQIFNVNTNAILTSAGILGLAVGFGAQNLVKDIISGFFIIFEDQFTVGDYVDVGGSIGTVEGIGLRTSKIRNWTGQLHIIPNGEITKVTNYNRGNMYAVIIIGIAYEEDIDRAIGVLNQECEKAFHEEADIVEIPTVQGIIELADSSVNVRIVARTVAGQQWHIERNLRRRFKIELDRAGIEIPYPRQVNYQR